jgi:hypothetical protein
VKNQIETAQKTKQTLEMSAIVLNQSSVKYNLNTNLFSMDVLLYPGTKLDLGDVILTYSYYDSETREIYFMVAVGDNSFPLSLFYLATYTQAETVTLPPVKVGDTLVRVTLNVKIVTGYAETEIQYKDASSGKIYTITKSSTYPILKTHLEILRQKVES